MLIEDGLAALEDIGGIVMIEHQDPYPGGPLPWTISIDREPTAHGTGTTITEAIEDVLEDWNGRPC